MKKLSDGREVMGIRAYAAHRKTIGLVGSSHSSVQTAVAQGRIHRICMEHDRCPPTCSEGGIDPRIADAEWAAYDLAQSQHADTGKQAGYADARTATEIFKGRMARLEYEQRIGKLVDASEVRGSNFRIARRLRDGMMMLGRRVAGRLVALTDRQAIQEDIDDEVTAILRDLSEWEQDQQ